MQDKQSLFKISPVTLWGVGFAALAVLLLGNARLLLYRLGLTSSADLVRSQLGSQASSWIGKLDGYTATRTGVIYAFWGALGLLTFGIMYAIMRTTQDVAYWERLSSNQYAHPANFNRTSFWRHILLSVAISGGSLITLLSAVMAYFLLVIPLSLERTHRFLIHPSLHQLGSLLAGTAAMLGATYVVYATAMLVLWSYRRSRI
jgi:hypothetical protein